MLRIVHVVHVVGEAKVHTSQFSIQAKHLLSAVAYVFVGQEATHV